MITDIGMLIWWALCLIVAGFIFGLGYWICWMKHGEDFTDRFICPYCHRIIDINITLSKVKERSIKVDIINENY